MLHISTGGRQFNQLITLHKGAVLEHQKLNGYFKRSQVSKVWGTQIIKKEKRLFLILMKRCFLEKKQNKTFLLLQIEQLNSVIPSLQNSSPPNILYPFSSHSPKKSQHQEATKGKPPSPFFKCLLRWMFLNTGVNLVLTYNWTLAP